MGEIFAWRSASRGKSQHVFPSEEKSRPADRQDRRADCWQHTDLEETELKKQVREISKPPLHMQKQVMDFIGVLSAKVAKSG
ncbi:hypothetical protein CRH15_21105 [Lelliottia amnigena]|nr:hypothetical protein CO697_19580 [Lelliottia amnigena]PEG62883.1 hypothetical protein CRH15_21105 [Lelliottia amnigena]